MFNAFKRENWSILIALFVLLCGIFGQWRFLRKRDSVERGVPLAVFLPGDIDGWTCLDKPIADTPEMKKAVAYWLNYNDAIFRIYKKGLLEVGLYVAYWQPGRTHPRLIQQHTPDICWTEVGWEMQKMQEKQMLFDARGKCTRKGQHRVFKGPFQNQHVIYWHIVGGEVSGYSQGNFSASTDFLASLWDDIWTGGEEQYFIRISASVPFDELQGSGLWDRIISTLGPLGLTEPDAR